MDSIYEYAWLTTQQIVVTSDKDGQHIKGFGSGFFFSYKDRLFLVTADHVSHPDDFDTGIRLGKDDFVWVFNNKNSSTELATVLTPIGGLYYFDNIDLMDSLSFQIPDLKDITFAILPNSFKYPFLAHELCIEKQVIVPKGKEKVIINSQCASELKESDYCLIEGCVRWNIVNGIRINRYNVIHQDLRLEDINNDGYYILKHSIHVCYDDWAGLSGGPVFNNNYRLIGMAIRVNEQNDTVLVMPINKITKLMDYVIQYEDSIKKLMD